jgi:hypothetical protein
MTAVSNLVPRYYREYVALQLCSFTLQKFCLKTYLCPKIYNSYKKVPNALKTQLTTGEKCSNFCWAYFATYVTITCDLHGQLKHPPCHKETLKILSKSVSAASGTMGWQSKVTAAQINNLPKLWFLSQVSLWAQLHLAVLRSSKADLQDQPKN